MNKTEILKIMDLLEKNKQAELNEYLKEQLLLVNMKASGGNAEVKRYKTAMRYIKNITDNRPTMKCAHVIDGVQYERKTARVAVGACDGECVETAELYAGRWYTNVIELYEYEI